MLVLDSTQSYSFTTTGWKHSIAIIDNKITLGFRLVVYRRHFHKSEPNATKFCTLTRKKSNS